MFIRAGTPSGFKIMSTGVPSSEVGHVFDRHDFGDNTLVAVTTCHLVAFVDLALLRHGDAHQLVDARCQFAVLVAVKVFTSTTLPRSP